MLYIIKKTSMSSENNLDWSLAEDDKSDNEADNSINETEADNSTNKNEADNSNNETESKKTAKKCNVCKGLPFKKTMCTANPCRRGKSCGFLHAGEKPGCPSCKRGRPNCPTCNNNRYYKSRYCQWENECRYMETCKHIHPGETKGCPDCENSSSLNDEVSSASSVASFASSAASHRGNTTKHSAEQKKNEWINRPHLRDSSRVLEKKEIKDDELSVLMAKRLVKLYLSPRKLKISGLDEAYEKLDSVACNSIMKKVTIQYINNGLEISPDDGERDQIYVEIDKVIKAFSEFLQI